MEHPTEAQIKEFWEWCGFKRLEWGRKGFHYEQTQKVMNWTHDLLEYGSIEFLPRLDLNNLFKYAVPKLEECHLITFRQNEYYSIAKLNGKVVDATDEDPALALFWALWKVTTNK